MAAPKTEVGVEASRVTKTESVLMSFIIEEVEMLEENKQRQRNGKLMNSELGWGQQTGFYTRLSARKFVTGSEAMCYLSSHSIREQF